MDHLLVDRLVGASLRLGTPLPGGVAIRYDSPVEDSTAFYTTIFKDGDVYRMYYRGALFERKTTCYAENRDGIHCFNRLTPHAAAMVTTVLVRMEHGNQSKIEGLSAGVFEYRIDFVPGYQM